MSEPIVPGPVTLLTLISTAIESKSHYRRLDRVSPISSGCVVQDAAAVFAADDFSSRFYTMRRLRGHFHVTASANFVFKRDNHRIAFAFKKTFETSEQILIDFAGHLRALSSQFFYPRLQSFCFFIEVSRLSTD